LEHGHDEEEKKELKESAVWGIIIMGNSVEGYIEAAEQLKNMLRAIIERRIISEHLAIETNPGIFRRGRR